MARGGRKKGSKLQKGKLKREVKIISHKTKEGTTEPFQQVFYKAIEERSKKRAKRGRQETGESQNIKSLNDALDKKPEIRDSMMENLGKLREQAILDEKQGKGKEWLNAVERSMLTVGGDISALHGEAAANRAKELGKFTNAREAMLYREIMNKTLSDHNIPKEAFTDPSLLNPDTMRTSTDAIADADKQTVEKAKKDKEQKQKDNEKKAKDLENRQKETEKELERAKSEVAPKEKGKKRDTLDPIALMRDAIDLYNEVRPKEQHLDADAEIAKIGLETPEQQMARQMKEMQKELKSLKEEIRKLRSGEVDVEKSTRRKKAKEKTQDEEAQARKDKASRGEEIEQIPELITSPAEELAELQKAQKRKETKDKVEKEESKKKPKEKETKAPEEPTKEGVPSTKEKASEEKAQEKQKREEEIAAIEKKAEKEQGKVAKEKASEEKAQEKQKREEEIAAIEKKAEKEQGKVAKEKASEEKAQEKQKREEELAAVEKKAKKERVEKALNETRKKEVEEYGLDREIDSFDRDFLGRNTRDIASLENKLDGKLSDKERKATELELKTKRSLIDNHLNDIEVDYGKGIREWTRDKVDIARGKNDEVKQRSKDRADKKAEEQKNRERIEKEEEQAYTEKTDKGLRDETPKTIEDIDKIENLMQKDVDDWDQKTQDFNNALASSEEANEALKQAEDELKKAKSDEAKAKTSEEKAEAKKRTRKKKDEHLKAQTAADNAQKKYDIAKDVVNKAQQKLQNNVDTPWKGYDPDDMAQGVKAMMFMNGQLPSTEIETVPVQIKDKKGTVISEHTIEYLKREDGKPGMQFNASTGTLAFERVDKDGKVIKKGEAETGGEIQAKLFPVLVDGHTFVFTNPSLSDAGSILTQRYNENTKVNEYKFGSLIDILGKKQGTSADIKKAHNYQKRRENRQNITDGIREVTIVPVPIRGNDGKISHSRDIAYTKDNKGNIEQTNLVQPHGDAKFYMKEHGLSEASASAIVSAGKKTKSEIENGIGFYFDERGQVPSELKLQRGGKITLQDGNPEHNAMKERIKNVSVEAQAQAEAMIDQAIKLGVENAKEWASLTDEEFIANYHQFMNAKPHKIYGKGKEKSGAAGLEKRSLLNMAKKYAGLSVMAQKMLADGVVTAMPTSNKLQDIGAEEHFKDGGDLATRFSDNKDIQRIKQLRDEALQRIKDKETATEARKRKSTVEGEKRTSEPPKQEPTKQESPKQESPKQEPPKQEPPKTAKERQGKIKEEEKAQKTKEEQGEKTKEAVEARREQARKDRAEAIKAKAQREVKAKAEAEAADKKAKEEAEAADKKAKEEAEAADKKAKEEAEAADKKAKAKAEAEAADKKAKAKAEAEAADKKAKEEAEAADKKAKAKAEAEAEAEAADKKAKAEAADKKAKAEAADKKAKAEAEAADKKAKAKAEAADKKAKEEKKTKPDFAEFNVDLETLNKSGEMKASLSFKDKYSDITTRQAAGYTQLLKQWKGDKKFMDALAKDYHASTSKGDKKEIGDSIKNYAKNKESLYGSGINDYAKELINNSPEPKKKSTEK